MVQTSPSPSLRSTPFPRKRIAVSLLFLANGLYMGAWSPKIPVLAAKFQLTEQMLGFLLLVFGLGSISIMPLAGAQIARFGSSRVAKITSLLFLPVMLFMTFSPNIYLLGVSVFLFGGLTGAMDVAMNANAVEVEKTMRRSIMSSCHAFWSMGALLGAGLGGFLIERLGADTHAFIATAANVVLVLVALPMVMYDGPHHEGESSDTPRASIFMSPLPWLLGIMALFSMLQEGLVIDWSSLYLSVELGSSLTIASLAAASFHGTMMLMRFAGDVVRDRFGAVRTFQVSALLALVGMVMAGFAPNAGLAITGFAISGLGVSNLVPIAFSAAGNLPGMAKGVGLSVVTALGYSGTLFAPTLFGFVIAHTGFQAIYLGAPLLLLIVLALSRLARFADGIRE